MFESMFLNEVINWFFIIGSFALVGYATIRSFDGKPLYGHNDLINDDERNERKRADRFYKAQKKALKAATKRA